MRKMVLFALLVAASGRVFSADPVAELPKPPERDWVVNLFESWKGTVPPRKLVGPIHYVGTTGVSSFLITTPQGHILLDTGFADTVPQLVASIEQLGFKPDDIRFILSSHAHIDHVGGHAEMKRLTGAQVVASAADRRILESGGADDYLPWPKDVLRFEAVKVDRVVSDNERINLGGVALTAQLTPGHTRGATTWTMEVKEDGKNYHVVFFSSVTVNQGVRLKLKPSYPEIMKDFDQAFVRLKGLPCDIFLAPHGGQFAMAQKFAKLDAGAGVEALVDKEGWRELVALAEYHYRRQIRAEEAAIKAAK